MAGALKVWDGAAWQTVAYGAAGNALPAGGATNMLLSKQSAADADAIWTSTPVVATISITSSATLTDGVNVVVGTTNGTKFGTSISQKQAWWNATPVVQSTGWSVTSGYTPDKIFNPASTTVNELATVLATLIDTLKTYGILGS